MALVAQMVERKTLNLVVVGSIPTGGGFTFFSDSNLKKTKSTPIVGLEPTTTRLRVLRSTN